MYSRILGLGPRDPGRLWLWRIAYWLVGPI